MDADQVRMLDTVRNCVHLSAEELQICWGNNSSYWEMVPNHDTEYSNRIARLKEVCWFDVKGELVCSLPPGTYTVSWRAKLSDSARGWESDAVNFTFSKKQNGREEISRCKCYLKGPQGSTQPQQPTIRAVGNGWSEYDVAEFAVEAVEGNLALECAMVETSGYYWKTGLSLDGIVIRPKTLVDVSAPQSGSARVRDAAGGPSNINYGLSRGVQNRIHLSAEELQICWGDDSRYWEMVPNHDTESSNKIARLIRVCWFDVKGEVECSLPPGAYTVSWRAKLSASARGWESDAVNFFFSKKRNDREEISRYKCYLMGPRSTQPPQPTSRAVENGWTEYDVAEFAVEAGEPGNLALGCAMVATSGYYWKTGLSLDGIVIRPKSSAGIRDAAGGPFNNSKITDEN